MAPPPSALSALHQRARHAIAPLRSAYHWASHLAELARVWNWQIVRTTGDSAAPIEVVYVGRSAEHRVAAALFSRQSRELERGPRALARDVRASTLISECPLPGAFRVAGHLTSLVPLDAPMPQILARCDSELRRRIRKLGQQGYRFRRVTETSEIERIYREMIVPFATARHGEGAVHHSLGGVIKMAKKGRLDLLVRGDEPVGAHLGYSYEHHGSRRFVTERFAYPVSIFSDPKRLADANAMNVQLACAYAHETGHHYYDLGISIARPDGGLLQWKRRRFTTLEASSQAASFFVLFPRGRIAQALAVSPLFTLAGDEVALNFGVRDSDSDEQLLAQFQEWGWNGIARVRLYTERPLAPAVLEQIRARYASRQANTAIEVVTAAQ